MKRGASTPRSVHHARSKAKVSPDEYGPCASVLATVLLLRQDAVSTRPVSYGCVALCGGIRYGTPPTPCVLAPSTGGKPGGVPLLYHAMGLWVFCPAPRLSVLVTQVLSSAVSLLSMHQAVPQLSNPSTHRRSAQRTNHPVLLIRMARTATVGTHPTRRVLAQMPTQPSSRQVACERPRPRPT